MHQPMPYAPVSITLNQSETFVTLNALYAAIKAEGEKREAAATKGMSGLAEAHRLAEAALVDTYTRLRSAAVEASK